MKVEFLDTISYGIRLKYSAVSISSLSMAELRQVINELNGESDALGCIVFEGDGRKQDLIIFAGNLERYSMLSVAREVGARVIYFQDTSSWWYGGSRMLPDIRGIAAFLRHHIGGRACLAFGQSSGGYAALAIGGMIPHVDVLACSPQTFADSFVKQRLNISPILGTQSTPNNLIDIKSLYSDASRSGFAAALFSASEFGNPYQNHFWADYLHLARLLDIPAIEIYLAASANHAIVFQRASLFSSCLRMLLETGSGDREAKISIMRRMLAEIKEMK